MGAVEVAQHYSGGDDINQDIAQGQRTRALMAFQMLCLRKPPFAIPTFLREEAPVPVLHWTGRHRLRSVVLVWGQLVRDTTLRYAQERRRGIAVPMPGGRTLREKQQQ
jgi:hypothetical protein